MKVYLVIDKTNKDVVCVLDTNENAKKLIQMYSSQGLGEHYIEEKEMLFWDNII